MEINIVPDVTYPEHAIPAIIICTNFIMFPRVMIIAKPEILIQAYSFTRTPMKSS